MHPLEKYPVLATLLSRFRKSQQKTLALFIASIAEVAQARTRRLAAHVSRTLGIQLGSAMTRFYRLLANPRIKDEELTKQQLHLLGEGRTLLIAIDWTKWPNRLQMLLASVVAHNRAIPVQTLVTQDSDIWQNRCEERFLARLARTLKALGQKAILVFDRGFHRVAWIQRLLQIGQGFLVRLVSNLTIQAEGEQPRLLSSVSLKRGECLDLGWVWLRQDQAVRVRVVGIWGKDQKEPWWLATNLNLPLFRLASLYHKRMDIEEQIRDTKGCRFGLGLEWTQFQTPKYLARLMLLVGMALVLWLTAGYAKAQKHRWARMVCKRKGARLSLVEVGIAYLSEFFQKLTTEFVRNHCPRPKLVSFDLMPQASA